MRRRDRAGRVLAIPNQIPNVIDRYGLNREQVDWELWAIAPDGTRANGAAAVNRTLHELGGVWRALAGLYRLTPIRRAEDRVYRWVAEHRPLLSRIWGAPPEWGE